MQSSCVHTLMNALLGCLLMLRRWSFHYDTNIKVVTTVQWLASDALVESQWNIHKFSPHFCFHPHQNFNIPRVHFYFPVGYEVVWNVPHYHLQQLRRYYNYKARRFSFRLFVRNLSSYNDSAMYSLGKFSRRRRGGDGVKEKDFLHSRMLLLYKTALSFSTKSLHKFTFFLFKWNKRWMFRNINE